VRVDLSLKDLRRLTRLVVGELEQTDDELDNPRNVADLTVSRAGMLSDREHLDHLLTRLRNAIARAP